jgi:chromosome segregation ATPase
MARQNSLLSTSPLIPTDFDEGLATASRHDSMNSMQGLEIAELKREVAGLASSEAQAKQSCNQISQELQICNADLAKKRTEIFEFAGKLSKQSRILKDFENKTITLRGDTKRQVREIQDKLDREKKKQIESDQNIAELRTEVDAKDTRIEELEARLSSTENPPDDPYHRVETTAPLTDAHHEAVCEEYQQLVFQQLGDAQALQTAAEAEVEGLRHLEKANADLTDGHAFDSELIKEMAKEKKRYRLEAQQLEDTVGELRVKQHLASETFQEIELANPVI